MFGWLWGLLQSLGLYQRSGKLLLLGLDNAGKTTLLRMLRDGHSAVHLPTQRATMEEMTIGAIKFSCHDLGGHLLARETWADYYAETSAIVFLVDSHDRARFAEARAELDALLTREELRGVPVLVLGNKVDRPAAASEAELRHHLGLASTTGKGAPETLDHSARALELFMCSVAMRTGYAEGMRWLAQYI